VTPTKGIDMNLEPSTSKVRARPAAFRIIAASALVASFAIHAPSHAMASVAPTYAVRDLGTLPGDDSSVAMGINASGQVVGWSRLSMAIHAFVYSDGTGMVELAAPDGRPSATARAINDAGDVVGTATLGSPDIGQGVRWVNGVPHVLGTLGTGMFSEAHSINAAGVAVGSSYTDGGSLMGIHAFRAAADGSLTDLTPGYDSASATGINASGQIAGSQNSHAVRWENGTFTDLGLAGFGASFGAAINDSGQVAGTVITSSGNEERIFRYTDGVGMVILGGLGEHNTALGINAAGDVVGSGRASLGSPVFPSAFLFTDAAGMVDVNTLIDPTSGWVIQGAGGINDSGQIAAWGFNDLTGADHALRLTPIAADTTRPSVRFANPTDGSTVSGTVQVKLVAKDDVAVRRVLLRVDGLTVCATATSTVLTCPWKTRTTGIGLHTLTGVAIDTSGNRISRTISVTVQR
jgi:probable HAF family extracellular repeat protein